VDAKLFHLFEIATAKTILTCLAGIGSLTAHVGNTDNGVGG